MAHYITDANKNPIKVAGNHKSNEATILAQITPLKKRYPIETWQSGFMWYVKYNDNWKECGGMYFMGNNGHFSAQIPLPLEFSNKTYILVTSLYRDEASPDTAQRALTQDYNHTYNSFGFCCNATGNNYCSFYACGY